MSLKYIKPSGPAATPSVSTQPPSNTFISLEFGRQDAGIALGRREPGILPLEQLRMARRGGHGQTEPHGERGERPQTSAVHRLTSLANGPDHAFPGDPWHRAQPIRSQLPAQPRANRPDGPRCGARIELAQLGNRLRRPFGAAGDAAVRVRHGRRPPNWRRRIVAGYGLAVDFTVVRRGSSDLPVVRLRQRRRCGRARPSRSTAPNRRRRIVAGYGLAVDFTVVWRRSSRPRGGATAATRPA